MARLILLQPLTEHPPPGFDSDYNSTFLPPSISCYAHQITRHHTMSCCIYQSLQSLAAVGIYCQSQGSKQREMTSQLAMGLHLISEA